MKNLLMAVTMLFATATFAQEKGIFKDGVKIDYETVSGFKAAAGASLYLTGIGSVKSYALFKGRTTETEFSPFNLIFTAYFGEVSDDEFSNKISSSLDSPNDFYLVRLISKGKDRRLTIGKTGTFSGSDMGVNPEDTIPFTFELQESGHYKIEPTVLLEDGEYAFIQKGSFDAVIGKAWTFTVRK